MEILWADFGEYDENAKLAAFERLKNIATENDLPKLVSLLKSEKNNFWTRELLSEPISDLGGTNYLPELFEAHKMNQNEGHDNDTLNHFLTEIAYFDLEGCKAGLQNMLNDSSFKHREMAEWLLAFCD